MPQIVEETVEVVLAPTERVQRRADDVPMPQIVEETVEVVRFALRERVQWVEMDKWMKCQRRLTHCGLRNQGILDLFFHRNREVF